MAGNGAACSSQPNGQGGKGSTARKRPRVAKPQIPKELISTDEAKKLRPPRTSFSTRDLHRWTCIYIDKPFEYRENSKTATWHQYGKRRVLTERRSQADALFWLYDFCFTKLSTKQGAAPYTNEMKEVLREDVEKLYRGEEIIDKYARLPDEEE